MSVSVRRAASAGSIAIVAGIAGALLVASPAAADTYTVINGNDTGAGSLEQAILDSNASVGVDDLIEFAPALPDIVLTTDLPPITDTVQIAGPVSTELLITSPNTTFTITGPGVDVEIGGLLLDTANNVTGSGIVATGANVTLVDVHTLGYPLNGVSVTGGSLSTNGSSFDDNGAIGVLYTSGSQDDNLSLVATTVNNNLNGLAADLSPGIELAYLNDVEAYLNNNAGVLVNSAIDADITIIDSHIHENTLQGIQAFLSNGSSIVVQDSLIEENTNNGIYLDLGDSSAQIAGNTIRNNSGSAGGGMYVNAMTGTTQLTISGNSITENSANSGDGGGIYIGSVLPNGDASTIDIFQNYIARNSTVESGGGLYIDDLGLGVPYPGGLVIQGTTFDANTAGEGGGIAIDSFTKDTQPGGAHITIIDSTISRNTAFAVGGGLLLNKGSATVADPSVIAISNSTISGNSADIGGGLALDGPDGSSNQILFITGNSTIVNNAAVTAGAGIAIDDEQTEFQLVNSILANNGTSDLLWAPEPGLFLVEYSNVRNPGPAAQDQVAAGPGNVIGVDPNLGPLADNGGPTETHLPNPGSPVFNTANPTFAPPPALDQRGEPRVLEGRLDMGAVESPYVAAPLPPTGSGVSGELVGFALLLLLGGAVIVVTRRRAHAG